MVDYVIISNAYTEEFSRSFVWRDKKIYIASEGKPENVLKEITPEGPSAGCCCRRSSIFPVTFDDFHVLGDFFL